MKSRFKPSHIMASTDNGFSSRVNDKLETFFVSAGLKVARQKFKYTSSRIDYAGENIYAILHAPRGDATEAIVLVGPWRNMDGELNRSGVALVLALARYFKSAYSLHQCLFSG